MRAALLKFIDDNHIENVVFVSSDAHWLSVNDLTYQENAFGPQIEVFGGENFVGLVTFTGAAPTVR